MPAAKNTATWQFRLLATVTGIVIVPDSDWPRKRAAALTAVRSLIGFIHTIPGYYTLGLMGVADNQVEIVVAVEGDPAPLRAVLHQRLGPTHQVGALTVDVTWQMDAPLTRRS